MIVVDADGRQYSTLGPAELRPGELRDINRQDIVCRAVLGTPSNSATQNGIRTNSGLLLGFIISAAATVTIYNKNTTVGAAASDYIVPGIAYAAGGIYMFNGAAIRFDALSATITAGYLIPIYAE